MIDIFGSHQSLQCLFPSWFTFRHFPPFRSSSSSSFYTSSSSSSSSSPASESDHVSWRDIDGSGSIYELDETGSVLRKRAPGSRQALQSIRCLHSTSDVNGSVPVTSSADQLLKQSSSNGASERFIAMTLVHNTW